MNEVVVDVNEVVVDKPDDGRGRELALDEEFRPVGNEITALLLKKKRFRYRDFYESLLYTPRAYGTTEGWTCDAE